MKNKTLIFSLIFLIISFLVFIFSQKINAQQNIQTNLIGEFSFTPSGEGFLLKWSAPQANFCFPLGEMWTNKFTSSGQQMVYPQYPTTYYLFCYNNRTKIYQAKELTITAKDLSPKIDLAVIPEKIGGLGDTVFVKLYILRKGDIKYCSAIDFYKSWQTKLGAQMFLQNQKVDIEKEGIFTIVKPLSTTDYVVECYNEKGELRAKDIARVTPNFSKYQVGYLKAERSGNNISVSWSTPLQSASYCLLTRGQEIGKFYLVNPSGSLIFSLPSTQNDFFTLDCFDANDYLVFQTYTDTNLISQSTNNLNCVPRGGFVVYDPSLGNVNEKCCPGLTEKKVNEYFGICQ